MTHAEPAATQLRVVVADDQAAVREGLATLLDLMPDLTVVGTAADGEQAVALAGERHPDVILMDLHMPKLDGVAATRRVTTEHPDVRVVVLTTYSDDASIIGALRAGALGYLTKDAGRAEISRALHAAAAGQSVLDAEVRSRLLAAALREPAGSAGSPPPEPAGPSAARRLPANLTSREGDVLRLIAAGLSNGQIARRLVISEATVKTHVNHIFAKTGARDRAQAVQFAFEHGLT
jgi:DNA-binding NarL/FixJ family response regulator